MKTIKHTIILLLLFTIKTNAQCWQSISPNSNRGYGVKADGSLYYWGYGTASSPTIIGTDSDWIEVYGGGYYFCLAKKINGTLWGWGSNTAGELGIGTTVSATIPTQVGSDTDWLYASAANGHTVALKTDHTLWIWGANNYGQLGDGSGILSKSNPEQLFSVIPSQEISAGAYQTLAIKSDGTLWAWGRNNYGQLGDGTLINKSVPTQIGTDTDWRSTSTSDSNSLALKNDGTMWAWGYNNAGQNGNGTHSFTNVTTPSQVGSDTDWQTIVSGYQSSFGLKLNGALYFFGLDVDGQVGDGSCTATNFDVPTQVGTDNNWSDIHLGVQTVFAQKNNGDLYSWGYNVWGQLGIGNIVDQCSPVLMSSCNLASEGFAYNALKIYPNPTTTILNISNNKLPIDKIIITDMLGKKILEQNGKTSQLDVQELQQGMYILRVFSDGGVVDYKFVKE